MAQLVILAVLAGTWRASVWAAADEATLAGQVLDAAGRGVPAALVLVCDANTGIPLVADLFQPVTQAPQGIQKLAVAIADDQGRFVFTGVQPGVYRVLAQAWDDATKPVQQPLDVNGRVVSILGLAPRVVVPSDDASSVTIRPIGTASLTINTVPPVGNDDTLLVVSQCPLAADPILGFAAWSGDFMPHLLAGNRMPKGKTTFQGLPDGTVYLAAFANDNNPGFGGISCELKPDQVAVVTLPLIASWSDGYKTPPERLGELARRLQEIDGDGARQLIRQSDPDLAQAMEEATAKAHDPWSAMIPLLNRTVTLEDGQQVLVKDLLAADGYVRLAKHDEERRNRPMQKPPPQPNVDASVSSVSYEQTLRNLQAQLGQTYPFFELKGINWQAVGERILPRAATVTNDQQFGLLCMELVAALQDSHAQLLPASAPLPTVPYPRWDAGFACLADERQNAVVYHVAPDSSAAAAGVRIGMMVESINGVPAADAIERTMEQLSRYTGYSSQQYLRYHAFRFFPRQENLNQEIVLQVRDLHDQRQTLMMRATAEAGYIPRLAVPIAGIPDSGNVSWKMLEDNIGYIYVRRISPDLAELLDQAIMQLRSARGLIVDVRGNSGGGFDAERSHRNFDLQDNREPSRPRYTGPVALLIDARCISAGEGWSSWFVARQRARLFGEATAGASARKTVYTLSNGLFQVRYPVKAYHGFLDRPIEKTGLVPDVPIAPTASDLAEGRDTVLQAAREWLLQTSMKE